MEEMKKLRDLRLPLEIHRTPISSAARTIPGEKSFVDLTTKEDPPLLEPLIVLDSLENHGVKKPDQRIIDGHLFHQRIPMASCLRFS